MHEDFSACYRAVASRDPRFDGRFVTAVLSTGIFCRPSCPALTPRPERVRFYPGPAAAVAAGFRACRRCRPELAPGGAETGPDTLALRATRAIAAGVVDAAGVAGLARHLSVSQRHLHRVLVARLGASAQQLAASRRAQTARGLIDASSLPLTEVAFAAGFTSVRQFNSTMRAHFGCPPSALRRPALPASPGLIELTLAYREPADIAGVLEWLATRAVPGVEEVTPDGYRRVVSIGGAPVVLEVRPAGRGRLRLGVRAADLRVLPAVVRACRRLFDLDADPVAVSSALGGDPLLAPAVARSPGRRVPGTVDGFEAALRVVLGQQVSTRAARTLAARLVARCGTPLDSPLGGLTHAFPGPAAVLAADLGGLGLTRQREATVRRLASAVDSGWLCLDGTGDPAETTGRLAALPRVGPWTVAAVAMRALGDPDAFPAGDLGLRRAFERAGLPASHREVAARAERWRPWRAYAATYLWAGALGTARRAG